VRARGSARGEAALLAAIHLFSEARAPRLRMLIPADAAPGDTVVLRGEELGAPDLTVHFGDTATWGMPLSPRSALAVVPGDANGPAAVSVSRHGLRSNSLSWGGPPGDNPARVLRLEPGEGATGIFRDTPVVALLSHAVDRASLRDEVLVVTDPSGKVPGRVVLSPDGRVLVWQGDRLLAPGVTHEVQCAGLRDLRGRELASYHGRFVACDLAWSDLA
jgi:hypothetical protein